MTRARRLGMGAGLCAAFLCSGAAALLFATLWFRLAGLALGNGIWASSLVLTAFMAGLALGNALAARLAPALARLVDEPLLIGAARAAVAFALMVLPATVMGAPLPLLARVLGGDGSFGVALGRLYGWNTIGGVLGALASETLLVPRLGLVATAACAAALQLAAASLGLLLDRSYHVVVAVDSRIVADVADPGLSRRRNRLFAAA